MKLSRERAADHAVHQSIRRGFCLYVSLLCLFDI
jgi:hypothetical protein